MALLAALLTYTAGLALLGGLIGAAIGKPSSRRITIPAAVALSVLLLILPCVLWIGVVLLFKLQGPP